MSTKQYFVLSLLQPWASLWIAGHKVVETRGWHPSPKKLAEIKEHGGRILVHASQGKNWGPICYNDPFKKYIKDFKSLPFGKILGSVELDSFFKTDNFMHEMPAAFSSMSKQRMEEEIAFGDFSAGRWGWVAKNPIAFEEPFPAAGTQSIWTMPETYFNLYYTK